MAARPVHWLAALLLAACPNAGATCITTCNRILDHVRGVEKEQDEMAQTLLQLRGQLSQLLEHVAPSPPHPAAPPHPALPPRLPPEPPLPPLAPGLPHPPSKMARSGSASAAAVCLMLAVIGALVGIRKFIVNKVYGSDHGPKCLRYQAF